MWPPSADSILARDPALSLQSSSSSSMTCKMTTLARSRYLHSKRGSSWSLSGTICAAVLAMAVFAPGRLMAQTTRDDGDVIDHSGLVMTTMQDRLFSVILNQLPTPRSERYTRNINFVGNLVMYTVDTGRTLQDSDLAFVSCDDSDAIAAFEQAIAPLVKPYCVVFYTVEHDWCDFDPGNTYTNVFTTLDREQANDFQLLLNNTDHLNVRIDYDKAADEEKQLGGQPNDTSSNSLNANQNSSVLGPTPSTSAALIILYSITGVITALFLLIIVVGAIRAHRHPERYGPRAIARFGRPPQSRAKGLARAVLDTLPIVRFGDAGAGETKEEVVKPADVEMQTDSVTSRASGEHNGKRESAVPPVASQTGLGNVGIVATTPVLARDGEDPEMPTADMDTSQLRCPVCMEDFESGQDLRVLPCHHSFHPNCIDPWLLNVVGSCPLCRIDLRPEDQRQSLETPPAPPEPEHTGSRFLRYLDITRGTTGEERMVALRQLREEERGSGVSGSRSRTPELGISRFRRVFRRRTSGSRSSITSGESSSPEPPSVTGGAEPVRSGEGLATINSLEIRERSADGRISSNQQQP